jgi:hypothetical protein
MLIEPVRAAEIHSVRGKRMNDLVKKEVPRDKLVKQGVTAVGSLIGGAALAIVNALPSVIGLVAGGVITVLGVGALASKDPTDKKAGMVITAAGGLTVLSRLGIFRGLTGGILGLGVVGLIGLGIVKGIQFLRGLKSRSS